MATDSLTSSPKSQFITMQAYFKGKQTDEVESLMRDPPTVKICFFHYHTVW